jgi:hypothetical protein
VIHRREPSLSSAEGTYGNWHGNWVVEEGVLLLDGWFPVVDPVIEALRAHAVMMDERERRTIRVPLMWHGTSHVALSTVQIEKLAGLSRAEETYMDAVVDREGEKRKLDVMFRPVVAPGVSVLFGWLASWVPLGETPQI